MALGRMVANSRNGESQPNGQPTADRHLEDGDLLLPLSWKLQPHLPTFASTSVTAIAPGAGCSITSAATVSTTGATGRFTFRAAFFTGARLSLDLATVRFAVLATLRALGRFAELALRGLALLCTFDPFLRLATKSSPLFSVVPPHIDAARPSPGNQTIELSTDRVVRRSPSPLHLAQRSPPKAKLPSLHTPIAKWLTTTTKSMHAYRTAAKVTSTWTRHFAPHAQGH